MKIYFIFFFFSALFSMEEEPIICFIKTSDALFKVFSENTNTSFWRVVNTPKGLIVVCPQEQSDKLSALTLKARSSLDSHLAKDNISIIAHYCPEFHNSLVIKAIRTYTPKELKILIKENASLSNKHWEMIQDQYYFNKSNDAFKNLIHMYLHFYPWQEVGLSSFSAQELARKSQQLTVRRIKKMGRIIKNYLSIFEPDISLISKNGIKTIYFDATQNHSVVLPQNVLEIIAKYFSLIKGK